MLKQSFLSAAILGAVLWGCGGDDDDEPLDGGDGGRSDSGVDAGDAGRGRLESGRYAVSNVQTISDGCDLGFDNQSFPDGFELTNTGTTITLGSYYSPTSRPVSWTPAGYALGSGGYSTSTTANLTVMTLQEFHELSCKHDLMRTSLLTYTGDNAATIEFTETESNFSGSGCAANGFPSTTCTSKFSFNIRM